MATNAKATKADANNALAPTLLETNAMKAIIHRSANERDAYARLHPDAPQSATSDLTRATGVCH
jgi:hypothetical protein